MGTHQTGNTQSYSNNLSRKSNALVANLARKHGQKMIANQVSPAAGQRQRSSQKRISTNAGNFTEREVSGKSADADFKIAGGTQNNLARENDSRQNLSGMGQT